MRFDSLLAGNFGKLDEAVTEWQQLLGKLDALKRTAHGGLKAKALKANWVGVNATVTREFIVKTAGEFDDARAQAQTIHNVLRDTHGELVGYRRQLVAAVNRAAQRDVTVRDKGDGGFTVTAWSDPATAVKEREALDRRADALVVEIQKILDQAAESDDTAAQVLRMISDRAKYGFSEAGYRDRDSAARAIAAADGAVALMKDARNMSPAEVKRLGAALEQYKGDALFAEQLAKGLGGEGTLQFWTDFTGLHSGAEGSELAGLKELQQNLSMTLATATHSDSAAMQTWKRQVVDAGSTRFAFTADLTKGGSPTTAIGFQVMSSLMGRGKFDAEFLDAYGKQLLKSDMSPSGEPGENTDERWEEVGQNYDLVFGEGDGKDPVAGLMRALAHSPEGATAVFSDKATLEHLMHSTRHTDRADVVGPALQAAATGVSPGEKATLAAPHSPAQVEVMRNAMHAVALPGSGEELAGELGDSLGAMAAAYMPSLSQVLTGDGAEAIFLSTGEGPGVFDNIDATRFLYEVGKDPEGRNEIILGEKIYSATLLEAHTKNPYLFDGTTSEAINTISKSSGLIQGIVGHANTDIKIEQAIGDEHAYNESWKQKGDILKTLMAGAVGVGTVAFLEVGGRATDVTAALASGVTGGVASMAIDRLVDGKTLAGAADESLYRTGRELNESLRTAIIQQQDVAVDAIHASGEKIPVDSTRNQIRESFTEGWRDSILVLSDTKRRPTI